MRYDIPMDFYPAPVRLTRGQKQRIRNLVQRSLRGEKVNNVVPQRSLVPILVMFALCILLGVTVSQPQVREFVAEAAARITGFFVREETGPQEETLPETELEAETPKTETSIGAEVTVGDVRLTVDKAILAENGLYIHLEFTHLTGSFDGDILQFDTLSLGYEAVPEQISHIDPWYNLMSLQWGEMGIYAGEVFALLNRGESPQSEVSYWLHLGTEKQQTGQYRLQIGRLFGCDTSAAEFVCTEYGDFDVIFTLTEIPEITPTVRYTPMSSFALGDVEYTLSYVEAAPLKITVEITCGRENTFSPEGFPELQLTPVHKLYGMFNAVRELELTGEKRNELYEQQYDLTPVFSTEAGSPEYQASSYSYSYRKTEAEEDAVYFEFAMTEPLQPDRLRRLVLERMDGMASAVIWEADE
ncbi:MAG: hypothetical protein IKY52_09515 [Clostridia bacterium]|nr:hypothetical protein [Clostridia bacterium]